MNDVDLVNRRYEHLMSEAGKTPAVVTAVAHPCEKTVLETVVEAAKDNLIKPILVGPIAIATMFGLTFFSRFPPPTEKIRMASLALPRLTLIHSENTVGQPSSLVRAVSSETVSVGA